MHIKLSSWRTNDVSIKMLHAENTDKQQNMNRLQVTHSLLWVYAVCIGELYASYYFANFNAFKGFLCVFLVQNKSIYR